MIILWANEKISHVKASKLMKCRSVKSVKISPFPSLDLKIPKFVLCSFTHPFFIQPIGLKLQLISHISPLSKNCMLSFEAKYYIEFLNSLCVLWLKNEMTLQEKWYDISSLQTTGSSVWWCMPVTFSTWQTDEQGDQKSKAILRHSHFEATLWYMNLCVKIFLSRNMKFVCFLSYLQSWTYGMEEQYILKEKRVFLWGKTERWNWIYLSTLSCSWSPIMSHVGIYDLG